MSFRLHSEKSITATRVYKIPKNIGKATRCYNRTQSMFSSCPIVPKSISQLLKIPLTTSPKITVEKPPPMKPSQVFFGLSLISGVFPKKKPNTQAITSLQMIMDTGTMNQIRPGVKIGDCVQVFVILVNAKIKFFLLLFFFLIKCHNTNK